MDTADPLNEFSVSTRDKWAEELKSAFEGFELQGAELRTGIAIHGEGDTQRIRMLREVGWKAIINGREYGNVVVLSQAPSRSDAEVLVVFLQDDADKCRRKVAPETEPVG